MKKKIFKVTLTVAVLVFAAFAMEVNAQSTNVRIQPSDNVVVTTGESFNCSEMQLTIRSVNNEQMVVQDACGNESTLTAQNNLNEMGITPACRVSIITALPNNGVLVLNVRCN